MADKPQQKVEDANFKYLVRIANTDLNGARAVIVAIRKIKGVNFMMAHACCVMSGINPNEKIGNLDDAKIAHLQEIIKNPLKNGAPVWLVNRRKDFETGVDMHVITNDLIYAKDNDLKTLKKIRSYRGIRHGFGLTVRGQRTKSKHRRNKRKGKASIGVVRNKTPAKK